MGRHLRARIPSIRALVAGLVGLLGGCLVHAGVLQTGRRECDFGADSERGHADGGAQVLWRGAYAAPVLRGVILTIGIGGRQPTF